MKVEISREEMKQVLLAKIAEMDPDEAKEELWEYYAEQIYPDMSDEELSAEFYDKVVASTGGDDDDHDDDDDVVSESGHPSLA